MKPPTDTQRAILSDAARHPHGLAVPPANLPPAPRSAVAKALLGAGLLARAEGDQGQHPGLAWRVDGESVLLRITEAGLQAIGAAPEAASLEPEQSSAAVPAGQAAAAAQDATEAAAEPPPMRRRPQWLQKPPKAPPRPFRGRPDAKLSGAPHRRYSPPGTTRQASSTPAWPRRSDHCARCSPSPLRRAPRSAYVSPAPAPSKRPCWHCCAGPRAPAAPPSPPPPAWAPHTVRGFLAALKKRGVAVLVHDRVRQVGPNKAGAKGSFTIYRIAEAG